MARLDAMTRVPRILRLTVKRILPRGLLARSLLIIVMPLVLLQVVSGVIFYDRHWSNVSRHRATALAGGNQIGAGASAPGPPCSRSRRG